MDFNKFDMRSQAEAGIALPIKDPFTGKVIKDGRKVAKVILRGLASPEIKAARREMRRMKDARKTALGDDAETDDEYASVVESLHDSLCDGAAPHIIGFESVSRGDKPAVVPDDVQWFLDLSFPVLEVKKDEDGKLIKVDAQDDEGNTIKVPDYHMANEPFAKQITDAASRYKDFLGNAERA